MTFLNAILLGGIAAVGIPLIIHLFNRSKPKVIAWGAMHLLNQAVQTNSRRLSIEQLILLLIRCSIPVLLALCMARPVFTQFSNLLGVSQSSLLIVLDDSYSMAAGAEGQTSFDQAREMASELVDVAGRGSDVTVMLAGGVPRALLPAPTFDSVRVNRLLATTRPELGVGEWPLALRGGLSVLGEMTQPVRDLIWISDFQKVNFERNPVHGLKTIAELAEKGPVQPQLVMIPVGGATTDNVAVIGIDYSKLVIGVGQKLKIRAAVKNFGERNWPELRVFLRVDGEERGVSQISLSPNEDRQVLFTHTFAKAGSHVIEVFAEADTLVSDNSRFASIAVWDRLPVLLVNGESSNQVLKNETDYLELALRPFGSTAGATNLINTKVVSPFQLSAPTLSDYRIVVLANVPRLAAEQLAVLTDFVRAGGGLLVFPGNRIQSGWYNASLAGIDGLLPLIYRDLKGQQAAIGTKIARQQFAHLALDFFNNPDNGSLSDAAIRIWYQTELAPSSELYKGKVLSQFQTGEPFLAEKSFGQGKVIQSSIPCDADWSNLPMRPFYVPLMQRLIMYLASDVLPPRNVKPGQKLVSFFPAGFAGQSLKLELPNGELESVIAEGVGRHSLMEYADTLQPGIYILHLDAIERIHFCVQPDPVESNLERVSDDGLEKIAENLNASVVRSLAEFQQLDRDRRFGREVWKTLLWCVLFLLFGELFFQQWLTRAR
ncbi:MAG: BatA domain-containing protein [Verrucomicrobiia bacterium]|jgi:hypothetical protein